MRELLNGQEHDVMTVRGSRRDALSVCLCALAALNLAVLMVVTQLPLTSPEIETVRQTGAQVRPVYLLEASQGQYRFQSCTGGDSVNCHRNGNAAGL